MAIKEESPAKAEVAATLAAWLARYGSDEVRLGDLLCDAHLGSAVALSAERAAGGSVELTYAELGDRSMRLAGALQSRGVRPGDRVVCMLPRSSELLVSAVAIWRLGAVHVPLFTAFGPDGARYRIEHSQARLVIVDAANRNKIEAPHVICVNAGGGRAEVDFEAALESGDPLVGITRGGDDLMMLLYTSGTTGPPKGVEVPVRALASIHAYMHYGLDLRDNDVYWNIADPGWGYGLWFGLIGPLLLGRTTLLRDVPFDPEDVLAAILERGVTNLTGPPTMYRSLRSARLPDDFHARSRVRALSSVGEPLNASLVEWSTSALGVPIHDHYGQSELGMVAGFAHHPALAREPVPGSMGTPSPGYRVVVLDEEGQELETGEGELAVDVEASPLYWFRGYFRDRERSEERFPYGSRYYVTGDAVKRLGGGLLQFESRLDDLIKSSAYRVGPYEVESALMAHPAVREVAVIGTPDKLRGEAVTAFVVTAEPNRPELVEELQGFVRSRLAKHLYPRRVVFVEALPRNPAGKVKRNVLREWWLQRGGS